MHLNVHYRCIPALPENELLLRFTGMAGTMINVFYDNTIVGNILIEEKMIYQNNLDTQGNPMKVKVGFADKVSVSVKRPRIYGTIYETEKISELSVFNIFPLPIKVNGSSWVYVHLIALASLIIFAKIQFNKLNKEKEEKWDSNSGGEYSSYSEYPT